ncbi:KpsF/GutQ family sugar-phosphate isomerase [Luteolibacter sp. GHJ8]|uniref:KpsF/GutQ family sugar-phosphate isomerase n=2 Tax=Luteolibacter rhizosphaerae TaxID=2989719 RepID=A0ABT3FY85_9BACT|nr:KpsF/GutQ family sugar-phosphate isomerase [Luteolibacter rhizosphaerae]
MTELRAFAWRAADHARGMDFLAKARQVIEIETGALQGMAGRLDEGFSQAISILHDTLDRRGKIVVVGIGKSGNIGHKIAATLNSTGATAVVLNSQNALHGDLGIVSDGDAVLLLSYSGETAELLDLLPHVKRFEVGLIALTGNPRSTLAEHSDVVLDTSVDREACPLNLAPTSSSTAMLVMGDALAMVLLEARGFTEEQFARFHPGGALGRALLTRVSDIMRAGDQMAAVPVGSTVRDALVAMSTARSGACVVTQPDGSLAGIFTHGDFARCYQRDAHVGDKPVADFMTRSPISVGASSLAVEALQTIGSHRVDDVVVLDAAGKAVGLVDTQDLARLKIV